MVKKEYLLVFNIILLTALESLSTFSQEIKVPEIIKDIAEQLASADADQESAATYLDGLYELLENPVNLNSGDEEDLSRLFFLSDFQVKALADYTRSTGKILSVNELAYIPGFDKATAEMVIPFCSLTVKEIIIADSPRIRNYLISNFSLKRGKEDSICPGSDWKVLTKYKFTAGSFKGGFTVEKDAGEKFIVPGTSYPDFYSASVAWSGKGMVRKIILGDYSVKTGQGTNINTGLNTGLSLTSQSYISSTNELKPYTSTDENNFLRGIATSLSYRNTDLTFFYSKNKIDATLGTTTGQSEDIIETLYKSGTHNSTGLLLKKDAVIETVLGINLSYDFRSVRIGTAISQNRFSLPIKPDRNNPEKIFAFKGDHNNVGSLYYNGMINNMLFYGEISANDLRRYTIVQGLSFKPAGRLIINFLYWNCKPGFTSFHGKGPGGNTGTYPEQSFLGNFTLEAAKHLFISGGYYLRNFPWLKYRCSSPSAGTKREVRLKYTPFDDLTIDLLYSYRLSMADMNIHNGIPVLKQMISRNMKAAARYSVQDNLTLCTRVDYNTYKPSGSIGFQLLEDISWKLKRVPLSFWLRCSIFRTDDYDSRIYTWENDLLYTFSIPSYYGSGNRFYLMASYKISGKAVIRIKYGVLSRYYDELADTDEVKIQIRIVI